MKFVRSLLFRLAITYAGLFLTSVILLLALFYWVTIWMPTERLKEQIATETGAMRMIHKKEGIEALASALQRRAAGESIPKRYHALIDPQGQTYSANLPSWPKRTSARWLQVEADLYFEGDEEDHEALVLDSRLSDGSRLLIGIDVEDIDDIEEALLEASTWGLPSLLLLVVLGAMAMSMAVTRRLDVIDAAARRVMQGSLKDRIPRIHSGDDLDRLAGTLNEMLSRIEQSMLSVRRVSDSVAHELRTPLARLHARLLEVRASTEAIAPESLAALVDEVELMIRMFDAVLRISRIESGSHTMDRQPVDLASVVFDVVEFYEPVIEERGLSLSVDVARDLTIVGDKDLIFQALANILDNAVKFTFTGGTIAIAGRQSGEGAVLTLRDTGPGIGEKDRALVTERFYRGADQVHSKGFGLGLALVAAVADIHGSIVSFANAEPGLIVRWVFAPCQIPSKPTAGLIRPVAEHG